MLADSIDAREVDFSHLIIADTHPESVESVRKQQSTLLWRALLLSLLLHLSLLLFQFGEKQFQSQPVPTPTVHIDLRQLPFKAQDAAPEIITPKPVEIPPTSNVEPEVVASSVVAEKNITVAKSLAGKPVSRLVIEPLSAQELAEVVDSNNAPTDYQGSAAIAENVFHPGLRAQLIEEAGKPVLARVENSGLQTYTDQAGTTVVVLGDGKCLKSPMNTKIGAPQNWYMASCGGKSESEAAMERVEQSINGKLKLDK
jgi:hypothetical protein